MLPLNPNVNQAVWTEGVYTYRPTALVRAARNGAGRS